MIYYIAHWDWILLQSRSEIVRSLSDKFQFVGITPLEKNRNQLTDYDEILNWKINRQRLIDVRGLIDLRNKVKNLKKTDTIHIFTLKTLILFLISTLLLKKQTYTIASITGLGYLFSKTRIAQILRIIIRPVIKKSINKNIDVLIFQNELNKDIFIEYSKFKNRIEIIEGSGLNTNELKIKSVFNKKTKVIFVGRLLKEKGIFEYLKIAKSFSDSDDIEFYVAGDIDGGNKSSINNKELEVLKQQVMYLGNIDIPNELFKYDLLINPSHHEGFSRVLLEGAYVGLYCIANDIPGTRNIIKNLDCGFVVENNNVEKYVELIKKRQQVIDNLDSNKVRNKIIQNYSVEAISNRFKIIYNKSW